MDLELEKEFIEKYSITGEAVSSLFENFVIHNYKRGDIIIETDKLCSNVFLIKNGLVRFLYWDTKGNEVTECFGRRGDFFASMYSYYGNEPAFLQVEAVSDMAVYIMKRDTLEKLCGENLEISNFIRKICIEQLYCFERKCKVFGKEEAATRYISFIKARPEILRAVSLKHIASYLGITQQSLSRLRAKLAKHK